MKFIDNIVENLKGPHDSTGIAIGAIVIIHAIDKLTSGNYELSTRNGAISILQRPADPEPEPEPKQKGTEQEPEELQ